MDFCVYGQEERRAEDLKRFPESCDGRLAGAEEKGKAGISQEKGKAGISQGCSKGGGS